MWWDALSTFQQVMFVIAVTSTAIMLIFLVLMIIGIDDADFDGGDAFEGDLGYLNDEPLTGIAGLKIFTIKGVLVFLSLGAWTAYLLDGVLHIAFVIVLALIIGFIGAFLQALAFRAMMKLESSGNINYENAIGKTGTVYITIPKEKKGKGKITMVVQDRFAEIDAITNDLEELLPKTHVEIIGLEDSTTVIVKKI